MDIKKIKLIGKLALKHDICTSEEFQSYFKTYKQAREAGVESSFLPFLVRNEFISGEEKELLVESLPETDTESVQPSSDASPSEPKGEKKKINAIGRRKRRRRKGEDREEAKEKRRSRREEKKDGGKRKKTWMMIGGGSAAALLLLVFVLFSGSGVSESKSQGTAYGKGLIEDVRTLHERHKHQSALKKINNQLLHPSKKKEVSSEVQEEARSLKKEIVSILEQSERIKETFSTNFLNSLSELDKKKGTDRLRTLHTLKKEFDRFKTNTASFREEHPSIQMGDRSSLNEEMNAYQQRLSDRKTATYESLYQSKKDELRKLIENNKFEQARNTAETFEERVQFPNLQPAPFTLVRMVKKSIADKFSSAIEDLEHLKEKKQWKQALKRVDRYQNQFSQSTREERLSRYRKDIRKKQQSVKGEGKADPQKEDEKTGAETTVATTSGSEEKEENAQEKTKEPPELDSLDKEDEEQSNQEQKTSGKQKEKSKESSKSNRGGSEELADGSSSSESSANSTSAERGKGEKKEKKDPLKETIRKLGQKYAPNGVLSIRQRKSVVAKGSRSLIGENANPWVKKTPHYIVRTNISKRAAGEIALVMELLYNAYIKSDVFSFDDSNMDRMYVLVFKTRNGFDKYRRMPRSVKGYYYRNSKKQQLVAYHFSKRKMKLTDVLLHEGTHQFVDNVTKSEMPTWLNEGLAAYFESSRFKGFRLIDGIVNDQRLESITRMMRYDFDVLPFSQLMRQTGRHFRATNYAQAWSFVHFLIHYKNGRLLPKVRDYFNYYKKENVDKDPVVLFKEIFGFHPNNEKLKTRWQNYVTRLRANPK